MKQNFKKVGAVVNLTKGVVVVKIMKVYMTNHVAEAGNMVAGWTLTQRLSFAGLMAFSAVAGMKAFVL